MSNTPLYHCEDAANFVKYLFKIYLEDRNFSLFTAMLHQNISWVGTGAHELCRNHQEAVALLEAEEASWDGRFKIMEQWYRAVSVCEDGWMVYGELNLIEDSPDSILLDMPSRFSLLCVLEDGALKLYHAHFSVANAAQTSDEFVHKTMIENYNQLLEEKLLERTGMLREKTEELETIVEEQRIREEELHISQKRYEVAMQVSNVTMFEYNILTKQLILFEKDADMYGITTVLENGMEAMLERGIILPTYAIGYREMYRKIHAGEPFASCIINSKDTNGTIHDFSLSLTTVYDADGRPIRAIGVRKNVSEIRQLQRENEFSKTMLSYKRFTCEADITSDRLLDINDEWRSRLGITLELTYSQAMELVCGKLVAAEHQELMRQKVSRKNIAESLDNGNPLISFQYKRLHKSGVYSWHEATINIIRDETTNCINIRYYTDDIDERKRKEQHAIDEQRLYENMIAHASVVYELNLSKNLFISGHDAWERLFGIVPGENYTEMIQAVLGSAIHPDDAEVFRTCCLLENVLQNYNSGNTQLSCEYRRPNEEGDFIWVRCTFHLYEDPHTGDIRGYAYIEDIDSRKKAELALVYKAEHDSLSGFYNKSMTEKLISDFLATADAKVRQHAFIMIDIDYFKSINDNFGHVFGDAVLSQTSAKIATLFRDDDVLGRVGGDEFIVFMKNIYNTKVATAKAEEIRALLCESYSQRGKSYQISASVGVAIYPAHGKKYEELYIHSDSALYISKKNGRNQVSLYNSLMELVESDKEFNPLGLLEPRTFEDSISEYVFRILYESTDKEASINAVLELVGKHLGVSRAYIFEDTPDRQYTTNTYEWCNDGVGPQIENLQFVPYQQLGPYKDNFNADGIFHMPDINRASPGVREVLQPQGVKSMLQFSICKSGEIIGFIGFDQCDRLRVPTRKEVSDCHNIAQILGVFLIEMRVQRQSKLMENLAVSIVNALDSYAYVCNPVDHSLLFINDSTLEISPGAQVGQKCYRAFWAREAPCEVCPMKSLVATQQSKYSMEIYNNNLHIWVRATASWIDWAGSGRVCLVDSVDVTQYKAI